VHVIPVHRASAGNDTGHRLVVLIAYEQMDETTRTNVIGILEKHKRFKPDFTDRMPQDILHSSKEEQGKWIFLQAAVWPLLALLADLKLNSIKTVAIASSVDCNICVITSYLTLTHLESQ